MRLFDQPLRTLDFAGFLLCVSLLTNSETNVQVYFGLNKKNPGFPGLTVFFTEFWSTKKRGD